MKFLKIFNVEKYIFFYNVLPISNLLQNIIFLWSIRFRRLLAVFYIHLTFYFVIIIILLLLLFKNLISSSLLMWNLHRLNFSFLASHAHLFWWFIIIWLLAIEFCRWRNWFFKWLIRIGRITFIWNLLPNNFFFIFL